MREPLSSLERSFVLAMLVMAAAALTYIGYRVSQGMPLSGDTEPFVVLHTSPVTEGPNNHAYQYVAAPNISWIAARDAASRLKWRDHPGYLATIDDRAEFDFIVGKVFSRQYPDVTYVGGRQITPGEWRWVTGPDAAMDDGHGRLFWRGDEKGRAPDDAFALWMASAFNHAGKWDAQNVCCVTLFSYRRPQFSTSLGDGDRDEGVAGYLVEFGN